MDSLNSNEYAFYFVDKNFGNISGIELVRDNPNLFPVNAHVIFMSGENVKHEVSNLERKCHILAKPFSIVDAFALIEDLIENKAA